MGFLSKLFGTKATDLHPVESTDSSIQSVPPKTITYSYGSDSSYFANQDVIEGMEFHATLQIRTPLDVLLHHGEIYKGPPSQAPRYGEWHGDISPNGIWLIKTKSFEQLATRNKDLAATFDNMESSISASDIGPVHSMDYLPFLIEFRRIVEGTAPVEDKVQAIENLKLISTNFASALQKLAKTYPHFPVSYFSNQLCAIPGVGPKMAVALFNAGFLSIPHLKAASLESLTSVQGVGLKAAKRILDYSNTL